MFNLKPKLLQYIFTFMLLGIVNQAIAVDENSYLTLAVGHVAIFDSDIDEPGAIKIEYRMPTTDYWDLSPGFGFGHTQGGASFAFAFVEKDFEVSDYWVIAVNFGLGSFSDGEDVEIGKKLEFRSGVRLSHRFKNDVRVGVELFHISNGGLGDTNPGVEPAFVSVYIPF